MKKSYLIGFILVFLFGPLGLLYTGTTFSGILLILTILGGIWVSIHALQPDAALGIIIVVSYAVSLVSVLFLISYKNRKIELERHEALLKKNSINSHNIPEENLAYCVDCNGAISINSEICQHCSSAAPFNKTKLIKELEEGSNYYLLSERDKNILQELMIIPGVIVIFRNYFWKKAIYNAMDDDCKKVTKFLIYLVYGILGLIILTLIAENVGGIFASIMHVIMFFVLVIIMLLISVNIHRKYGDIYIFHTMKEYLYRHFDLTYTIKRTYKVFLSKGYNILSFYLILKNLVTKINNIEKSVFSDPKLGDTLINDVQDQIRYLLMFQVLITFSLALSNLILLYKTGSFSELFAGVTFFILFILSVAAIKKSDSIFSKYFPELLRLKSEADNLLNTINISDDSPLKNLWTWADKCKIPEDSIPRKTKALDELRELILSNSNLESLPSEIACLNSLEELYLNDNNLKTLPDQIVYLQSLKVLRLNGNDIEYTEEQEKWLANLEESLCSVKV